MAVKRAPMSAKDRRRVAGLVVLTVLLAGTCWYAGSKSAVSWHDREGRVVSRRQVMPQIKQIVPLRYEITIRDDSGEYVSFYVSREQWQSAQIGKVVRRDRFGNVTISGR